MRQGPARTTVDIGQIAKIAKVGRSAVGNWRKRHTDFPIQDLSGRFDLIDIEKWLIENGKIDSRVPAEVTLWSLVDSLRYLELSADKSSELLASLLVYLEACENSLDSNNQRVVNVTVNSKDLWAHLSQLPAKNISKELIRAAKNIERTNPNLAELIVNGLSNTASLPGELLVELITNFEMAVGEGASRFELLESSISRTSKLNRFSGKRSTPSHIAELMIRLAGKKAGTVCDLACGEGGLLSSFWLNLQKQDTKSINLIGYDIDEDALRVARSRFFLQKVTANLYQRDSLRVPQEELPKADIMLLDPPLGLKSWGDAAIYLDKRWRFGVPPRQKADLAWMQLAIQCLSESGIAVITTSSSTASSQDPQEVKIRKAMLEAGVIKAVIQLPSRIRAEISTPISLWILQPPQGEANRVLLVDASILGATSRSQHNFSAADISRITRTLQALDTGEVSDKEISQIVSTKEIINNNAVLALKRYKPMPEINLKDVYRDARELKGKLATTMNNVANTIELLLSPNANSGSADSLISCSLDEVAEIHLGTQTSEVKNIKTQTRLIGLPEVCADEIDSPRYADRESSTRSLVEVRENDVVVALRNNTGRSIIAKKHPEGAVLGHGCALIRSKNPQVTASWLYLWTQSKQFHNQVTRATDGIITPALNTRSLREFSISIPTDEQLNKAELLIDRFDNAEKEAIKLQSDLTELRALEVELLIAHDAGIE